MKEKRKIISIIFKFCVAISAFLGVTLACVFAERDGYSPWITKLMYFTHQSNIWIGVTYFVLAILQSVELAKGKKLVKRYMYVLRYIFTVSITITGVVYCALLAPFADFNPWSFYSVLTHVVVPVLAITDFCIDKDEIQLAKREVPLALIPLFVYFVFASILSILKVDFGKGDPYPYFFFDYYTEAGLFGFVDGYPPQIGSAYWIVLILFVVLGISWLYFAIHKRTRGYGVKKTMINKLKKDGFSVFLSFACACNFSTVYG